MNGLSEYQNFNGVAFHALSQNEFEFDKNNEELRFCTKLADAAHKSIITDLLPYRLNNYDDKNMNLLISSSWDGTVKIWK